MPWVPRGLREGVVTSSYPRGDDGYGPGFRGVIEVRDTSASRDDLERTAGACPTGAISVGPEKVSVDRGAGVLCGRCVAMSPAVFRFVPDFESSSTLRAALVVPTTPESDAAIEASRSELAIRVRALRRSLHVRHVDAGSDGADEWEIAALTNPIYDVQRLGVFFTASPRHADILLVTGVGSAGMIGPLRETWEAMAHPKVLIACGVDAISGGLVGNGYASRGGITSSVPVDVFVPGSPATPFGVLHALLMAANLLSVGRSARGYGASSAHFRRRAP
jgi:Ni,Fe-hydrogenase III small subunit/ferredoxin